MNETPRHALRLGQGKAAVIAVLALVAALSAVPVAADEPDCSVTRDGIPTLCGITTITADRNAAVRLHVPRATVFAPSTNGDYIGKDGGVSINGTGLLPGFVLARLNDSGEATGMFAARVDPESVQHSIARAFGDTQGNIAVGFTVPAGDYVAYVLAGKGPVTVTLRPSGYAGSTELAAALPVQADAGALPVAVSGPANATVTAGRVGRLEGPGLLVRAVYVLGTPYGASLLGTCAYRGAPDRAYLPHCPGSPIDKDPIVAGTFPHVSPAAGGSGAALDSLTSTLPAGEYGQQVWYHSASAVRQWGSVGLWLTLLDGPTG